MVIRFWTLILGLTAAYSLLLFRLYDLQVVKGDYYHARSESQYVAQDAASSNRGVIYFTDKNNSEIPATLNKDFPIIYAVPKDVEDPSEAANTLAGILNKPVSDLAATLSKTNDSYEVLLRKADADTAKAVDDLKINGIYVDTEVRRYYPFNDMASQVLGYVGPKSDGSGNKGYYGVEGFYDSELAGGDAVEVDGASGPKSGADITLTIDPNIQSEAEKILENLLSTYNASGGSFVVEDPQTGKILAMGGLPDFDPNNYGSAPMADFLNPTVQQIYEPGLCFQGHYDGDWY